MEEGSRLVVFDDDAGKTHRHIVKRWLDKDGKMNQQTIELEKCPTCSSN